jgi:NADH-quinone oxidoreductase subunit D
MATASDSSVHATAGAGTDIFEPPRPLPSGRGRRLGRARGEAIEHSDERIVVNMGPQHPSTHGVLRLILELDGETVTEARVGIGYLHTGIEKNMEFRTFTQGVTFCTRMDYLTPMFQETAYCLAVEKLLGITDEVPERATLIRVLMMELNRISSHLVCLGTGGMELGATTVMTVGFRERERSSDDRDDLRPADEQRLHPPRRGRQDLPSGSIQAIIRDRDAAAAQGRPGARGPHASRTRSSRAAPWTSATSTSPAAWPSASPARSCARGLPYDLRKAAPYCGYENYDFDVPPGTPRTPTAGCGSASTRSGSR